MYSKIYLKHFSNPKNIGSIDNADAVCNVINTEGGCFDTVDVYVKSNGSNITDFKYKLKACSGTITAFSLLSEVVRGMRVDELDNITFDFLDEMLGHIPEKKYHSLRLAIEATDKIKGILKNKKGEQMKIKKEMSITEIVQLYPEAHEIFRKFNLGCIGCIAAQFETLEDGLIAHGINVEDFLKEINKAVE